MSRAENIGWYRVGSITSLGSEAAFGASRAYVAGDEMILTDPNVWFARYDLMSRYHLL
jgi:hypothetical protein